MNTNDWYGKIAPLEGVLKYSEGFVLLRYDDTISSC